MKDRFGLEQSLRKDYDFVIGCDEVGRGALAGPVVAAAVIFDQPAKARWWKQVDDSKNLPPDVRQDLSAYIKEYAVSYGIGQVLPQVIDEINIHHASLRAMRDAIREALIGLVGEAAILVDGKFTVPTAFDYYQQAIVGGDGKVHSIAAASIIAKVHRDELMRGLESDFPVYQFGLHKGYATPTHRKLIKQYGPSSVHRLSFCGNIV